MLFHTLDYLLFLPLCVALYWLLPRRYRMWVLGLSSVFFYGSWSGSYLLVLAGVTVIAWLGGLWLAGRQSVEPAARHLPERVLVLGALLFPLLFFKYWDWIAENIDWVTQRLVFDLPTLPRVDMPLPVGISFFTFQALAYVIDTARAPERGGLPPERDLGRFGTFLAFFPQLVAGPIVRRQELLPQLVSLPLLQQDQVGAGLFRIARGMAKKVLIADIVRVGMVDPVFSDPGRFTGPEILVALYAYTLQIYYDFSAYTDIAIGSARLFGIELPENFRRPYQATCVAGFWRRWHITLSNWVRDYVYYPLGGSRVRGGQWKVYRNVMATLVIIGIWHGASWNFVVYGTLHGLAVAYCRLRRKQTGRRPDDPLPSAWSWLWRWFFTFHFVVLARILFRAEDLSSSWALFTELFDPTFLMPRYSMLAWGMFGLGYLIHFTPMRWSQQAEAWFKARHPAVWALVAAAVGAGCLSLGGGEQLAFIYYQF
ncbi:MAG: MBOAT family protein [Alphaproteobacteria bacterium]|nr:MBOAT family protein [Alphaproteobacteria bacterium]